MHFPLNELNSKNAILHHSSKVPYFIEIKQKAFKINQTVPQMLDRNDLKIHPQYE